MWRSEELCQLSLMLSNIMSSFQTRTEKPARRRKILKAAPIIDDNNTTASKVVIWTQVAN